MIGTADAATMMDTGASGGGIATSKTGKADRTATVHTDTAKGILLGAVLDPDHDRHHGAEMTAIGTRTMDAQNRTGDETTVHSDLAHHQDDTKMIVKIDGGRTPAQNALDLPTHALDHLIVPNGILTNLAGVRDEDLRLHTLATESTKITDPLLRTNPRIL
jgi:hypothetical protein